ncbi:branched-chain amino acid ABC transporter permease [Corynebacterium sp. HMSC06D04]|uniref:Branched-chain amino acid ABC transporter permease n=2 Tax=Corynebacterium TaxID=1716 RepID=A0A2A4AL58_9CORY|nr:MULTISPECIES: AzlD domain-containing protein [Corynebacterium]PCC83643.1 branched-chain amino acid ABC transporter permease [Corynebacterium accolens]AMO91812.1 branched-chain amino acid transport family protein [Corynebacterium simulans]KXU17081.1 branched-chain amino acid transport family protein [Corynebacterium simulans]MCG7247993.1 AzlD domain-containing protein [Corynebacterium simulans]MCK6160951.1 AzlD domain-containing protein [Corynebacterium simulans]
MPAGVSLSMVAAVLLPICVVTLLLRELPFSFIKALKGSQFIGLLGMTMPVGVMTVLVVYTVYGQKEAPGGILAALIGVAITAGLHWWRKSSAFSIFGGTAAYVLLVNFVF